jgi:hypothetical protein
MKRSTNPFEDKSVIDVKTLLVKYEFDELHELFAYIVESRLNGQKKQAREIYYELPSHMGGERYQFLDFLTEMNIDAEEFRKFLEVPSFVSN